MGLTRDQILAADDIPREEVPIPQWGGSVWVRTMTAGERDKWELANQKDMTTFRARTVVAVTCDEAGKPLFRDADIPALMAKSSEATDLILPVAKRLNGLGKEDIDELEKNSGAIPTDASSSSSPAI